MTNFGPNDHYFLLLVTINSFRCGASNSTWSKMDVHIYILLYVISLITYHFFWYRNWFCGNLLVISFQNRSKKMKVMIVENFNFDFVHAEASGQPSSIQDFWLIHLSSLYHIPWSVLEKNSFGWFDWFVQVDCIIFLD